MIEATPDTLRFGQAAGPFGAFIACGLGFGKIDAEGLTIVPHIAPPAELDRLAAAGSFDLTFLSPAVWHSIKPMAEMLPFGCRLRRKAGPWLVAKHPVLPEALAGKIIAVPSALSSAALAAKCFLPKARLHPVPPISPWEIIARQVADGKAEAGILPPEAHARPHDSPDSIQTPSGPLAIVLDLAERWTALAGNPLPLSLLAVRSSLDPEVARRATRVLRRSLQWSLDHRDQAQSYVAALAPQWTTANLRRVIENDLGDAPLARAAPPLDAFFRLTAGGDGCTGE